MKTLYTITYILLKTGRQEEATRSFVRPYSQKKPTYIGAARIIANEINERNHHTVKVLPSDIAVIRIQSSTYQTR